VLNVRGVPTVPGTPRNVSVGDGQVVATWTSVLDTGGLPVLRYWVTAVGTNGDRVRQECPTTTCTVTALRNAVEYKLTVTAENQLGEGPPSPESAPMIPDVVPDQMAAPTVQRQAGRTGGALVISWAAPTNRGSAITSYTVTMKTAGGQSRTASPGATSFVWDNLSNGTDYSFSVQATNNSGTSAESEIGTGRPSAPADAPSVSATDGNAPNGGSLLAQWHAPASDNGERVTAYLLNVSTNKDSFSIDGPADVTVSADSPDGNYTHLFEGLTNGVNYYIAVRAVNAAGNSDVGRSPAAMPYGVPTVPEAPKVVPGDRQATVSMGATAASPGATIVEWMVSGWDNDGHTVTNKMATAHADGGFSLTVALVGPNVWGRTWQFTAIPRVQSANGQIKEGSQSPVSNPVQPKGAPGTPDVAIAAQQGVSGSSVFLLFGITRGDGNGNPPTRKLTYSSPWGSGTANDADQFQLTVPMAAAGTVTALDGLDSTGSVVVQQTVSVNPTTSLLTVRYVPETVVPLFCQVLTGTTVSGKTQATDTPDGSSTYHTYTYSYETVPAETTITLQCGGDNNDPTTYQISTTK